MEKTREVAINVPELADASEERAADEDNPALPHYPAGISIFVHVHKRYSKKMEATMETTKVLRWERGGCRTVGLSCLPHD